MKRPAEEVWRHRTLRGCVLLVALIVVARLFQIQIAQHQRYSTRAEKQWRALEQVPAERGNLYDRAGRPLALSVTSWRVGVATGRAEQVAEIADRVAEALDLDPESTLGKLRSAKGAHVVLYKAALLSPAALRTLQNLDPVTLDRLRTRVYPQGAIGASLLGFYRGDEHGEEVATGLERSLGSYLGGTPGEAWRIRTAREGQNLGYVVRTPAEHGHNLVLTLDADLQSICEDELARSVVECGAAGGSVMIADPQNGDILAAASWPLLADRTRAGGDPAIWNNSNFCGQLEPGSLFKIFTAASLLGRGAIDTATVYDCTDGDFGNFVIRNSDGHVYGNLSFMPAFAQSSNIYFARAVANLAAQELFHDLTEFGFGQQTSFPYPAQLSGILKSPSHWSGRSQATLAIGQEIAATPLQIIMAVCAVANGGTLYAPRIVREVRDHDNGLLESVPAVPLHRVISQPLAALLREAMARVVSEGTGRAATLNWVRTGGKTGTAQKSRDGRGYTSGCYVASFVGCVPIERPRLVILTILDEPDSARHYASQTAVPLFARIVTEIRRSTGWLTAVAAEHAERAAPADPRRQLSVPDVLYLSVPAAVAKLAQSGLAVAGADKHGVVVEQIPGPGSHCAPGASVALTVAAQRSVASVAGMLCPDLIGLSHREVMALVARLGIPVAVSGTGYVADQRPAAGTRLGTDGVRVLMRASWR